MRDPAAVALGRLIVLTVGLALIVAGIVFATSLMGTLWPALLIFGGTALIARMAQIANRKATR